MINITVDCKLKTIEIEGEKPIPITMLNHPAIVINLIVMLLNKAYYSGEALCLEVVNEAGQYSEIDRW